MPEPGYRLEMSSAKQPSPFLLKFSLTQVLRAWAECSQILRLTGMVSSPVLSSLKPGELCLHCPCFPLLCSTELKLDGLLYPGFCILGLFQKLLIFITPTLKCYFHKPVSHMVSSGLASSPHTSFLWLILLVYEKQESICLPFAWLQTVTSFVVCLPSHSWQ